MGENRAQELYWSHVRMIFNHFGYCWIKIEAAEINGLLLLIH